MPVDSHDDEQSAIDSNLTENCHFLLNVSQEISNKVRGLEYQPATKKSLDTHYMEAVNVLYFGAKKPSKKKVLSLQ